MRCGEVWGTQCKAWVQGPSWSHGLCPSPEAKINGPRVAQAVLAGTGTPRDTVKRRCGEVWGTQCKAWVQGPSWTHGLCLPPEAKRAVSRPASPAARTEDSHSDRRAVPGAQGATLVLPGGAVMMPEETAGSPGPPEGTVGTPGIRPARPRNHRSVMPLHLGGAAAKAPAVNPNTWAFIEFEMKPLAARLQAGEDREVITQELFVKVLPWVLERIRRECSHLPTGADAHEIMSQMLIAAWRTAGRYDPACPQSWPTALKRRLAGAWLEAYRTMDFVTRKHRTLHNQWRIAVEQEVNQLGRELSDQEKMEVARKIAPQTPINWAHTIMFRTPPPALGGDVIEHEQVMHRAVTEGDQAGVTDDLAELASDPAERVCAVETSAGIYTWMAKLPARLQRCVRLALEENKPIPKADRAALGAWLPELMAQISDHDLASPLAAVQPGDNVVIDGSLMWDQTVNATTVFVLSPAAVLIPRLKDRLPTRPAAYGRVIEMREQAMVVDNPHGAKTTVNVLATTSVYVLGS